MFWRDSVERKIADAFGFEYCTLFDTARSALRWLENAKWWRPELPSNVCPILGEMFPRTIRHAVDPETGMAPVAVQQYGYRKIILGAPLDLDPLMTGFLREPFARYSVISFNRKKMLDIGGGGALLSNEPFKGKSWFPEGLRPHLSWRLRFFRSDIASRWEQIDKWDRYLGDSCIRIPQEQIMPWRVMRRISTPSHWWVNRRDMVVRALRQDGYAVGTNYSPLPGVTDEGAIQWGQEVINFFPEEPDIRGACEIIKRVIDDNHHS